MPEPLESRVLSKIDEEYLVSLTQRLVRMKTPNPPADYSEIYPAMKSIMESLGLEVKVLQGMEGKPNVVGLWRGTDPTAPTLLLDAHMDVVAAGEGWEVDPWAAEIRDGAIWGRGTADLKGSLAIMATVVKALKDAEFRPRGNLLIAATNDDETAGKYGLKYVIEQGLTSVGWPTPDFHFLLEASNWNVNVAFKGRVWIRITVKGESAHGGTPEKGVNAITKMMDLIRRLLAIERHTHPLMPADSINVGTIQGGEKTNIVPDTCTATFDYRFVGPYSADDAVERFREVVSRMESEDPTFKVTELEVFEKRDPVEADPGAYPLALLAETIKSVSGRSASPGGTLSAGNAYWSLKQGITATMTGPGDPAIIHTSKEHISLADISEGARIVAAYAVRYIG
ncbi:MAG: M20 family metallopeptidase [Bacillota bacterium]